MYWGSTPECPTDWINLVRNQQMIFYQLMENKQGTPSFQSTTMHMSSLHVAWIKEIWLCTSCYLGWSCCPPRYNGFLMSTVSWLSADSHLTSHSINTATEAPPSDYSNSHPCLITPTPHLWHCQPPHLHLITQQPHSIYTSPAIGLLHVHTLAAHCLFFLASYLPAWCLLSALALLDLKGSYWCAAKSVLFCFTTFRSTNFFSTYQWPSTHRTS